MTAIEIALAGYLAFGQLTGNSYEAITDPGGDSPQTLSKVAFTRSRLSPATSERDTSFLD